MGRAIVDQILSMLGQSFEPPPGASATDGWHSLLSNLRSVRDEDWDWVPPSGKRTISHLAIHCGFGMRMYADHGFGQATLQMSQAQFPSAKMPATKENVVPWLRESYLLLHNGLAGFSDEDLLDMRRTHWGEDKPRRWFAITMIEHNLYHAGEINHIRALVQQNDN